MFYPYNYELLNLVNVLLLMPWISRRVLFGVPSQHHVGDGTGTSGTEYTMVNPRDKNGRKGSNASVSDNDISWMCEECGKQFKSEKDKLLESEYCGNHYCIKCLNYNVGKYEAMQKPGFCMKCKPKVEKTY